MTSAARFTAKALTAVAARIAAAKRIERNEIMAILTTCHRIRSVRRSEQGSFGVEDNQSDLAHRWGKHYRRRKMALNAAPRQEDRAQGHLGRAGAVCRD